MRKLTKLMVLPMICVTALAMPWQGALAADKPAAKPAKAAKVDLGEREFRANCVVCHGYKAKGDGSYVELLKTAVPDLTTLSKRNNGVFPFARVYETIDGTKDIKAHGTRDMPIWGQEYKIKAAEHHGDVDYDEPSYVRARVLALTEYIYRLQEK